MRWGDGAVRFVRPIQRLVSLYGSEVAAFELASLEAGRESFGHRFLAGPQIRLAKAGDYVSELERAHVIVDPQRRRELIEEGLRRLGVDVRIFSVRPPGEANLLCEADRREAQTAVSLLPTTARALLAGHGRALVRHPHRYLATLRRALSRREGGVKALLWAAFHFAEAILLAEELHRCAQSATEAGCKEREKWRETSMDGKEGWHSFATIPVIFLSWFGESFCASGGSRATWD